MSKKDYELLTKLMKSVDVVDPATVPHIEHEEELKDDLSNYKKDKYEKPSVTVDVCICRFHEDQVKVLLIKRKKPPFRDMWAIPGGFLNVAKDNNEDITLEKAALRELNEETGIKKLPVHQLATYGDAKRDPRMRVVTVAYFAIVTNQAIEKEKVVAADDAKEVGWFSLHDLPKLAFDHKKILKDLLERIQGRIQYTDMAFNFLPKTFTWSQLQKVYEVVLNRELVTPNFRRKIKSSYNIAELDTKNVSCLGRPSKFLQYDGIKPIF